MTRRSPSAWCLVIGAAWLAPAGSAGQTQAITRRTAGRRPGRRGATRIAQGVWFVGGNRKVPI